jgi:PIN domain
MPPLRTNYVLIDFENVQVKSIALLEGDHFRVKVFLGPKNTRLPAELVVAVQRLGDRAEYITLDTSGSNALDFHIAYHLGVLSAKEPSAYFHVISRDTGFDPLIQHLKSRSIYSCRSVSIEEMPCFAVKKEVVAPAAPVVASDGAVVVVIEKAVEPIQNVQPEVNKKPPAPPPPVVKPVSELEKNFKLVHEDLIRRKASKPRKVKTLKNTMQARCGKDVAPSIIDSIFQRMVTKGFVKIDGEKVSYALPQLKSPS